MELTEEIVNIHSGDAYRIRLGSRQSEVEDMFEGAFVTNGSVWSLGINGEAGPGILDRHPDVTGSVQ